MFRASKKADDFIKIIENTGKNHKEMTAEEFWKPKDLKPTDCVSDETTYIIMEAYAKHENAAKDKQIAELEAENNKLKSILNSPSKGDY